MCPQPTWGFGDSLAADGVDGKASSIFLQEADALCLPVGDLETIIRQIRCRLPNVRFLIRVKKGIYVLGAGRHKLQVSKEVLANLIYGPSYVSLDSALAFYGLIPECVMEGTSVTRNRNKHFATPLGRFSYRYLSSERFSEGVRLQGVDDLRGFLIATPEKALVEKLWFLRDAMSGTMESCLREDFRIDLAEFHRFSVGRLQKLVTLFKLPHGEDLVALVTAAKKGELS